MNFSQIRPAIKITMLLTLILVSALAWAAEEKALGDKVAVVNGVTISKDMYDREATFRFAPARECPCRPGPGE